jgi:hypothetical protein
MLRGLNVEAGAWPAVGIFCLARFASCQQDAVGRPTVWAIVSNGIRKTSCSTKTTRSAGLSFCSMTSSASRTLSWTLRVQPGLSSNNYCRIFAQPVASNWMVRSLPYQPVMSAAVLPLTAALGVKVALKAPRD